MTCGAFDYSYAERNKRARQESAELDNDVIILVMEEEDAAETV